MNDTKITFTVPIERANTILQALNQMPYGAVAELISNLQQQAQAQLKDAPPANDPA